MSKTVVDVRTLAELDVSLECRKGNEHEPSEEPAARNSTDKRLPNGKLGK